MFRTSLRSHVVRRRLHRVAPPLARLRSDRSIGAALERALDIVTVERARARFAARRKRFRRDPAPPELPEQPCGLFEEIVESTEQRQIEREIRRAETVP